MIPQVTAGLPDPNQAPPVEPIGQKRPATTTATPVNPKVAKAKSGTGTYAEAIIGKLLSSEKASSAAFVLEPASGNTERGS